MDTSKSKFKLYNSSGTVLLYTFFAVNYTNAPQSVESFVEHNNPRGKGAYVIKGGETPWDLLMRFHVQGDSYEEVASAIKTLEDTIEFNEPYILRIFRSDVDYDEYRVKRLESFDYIESLRLYVQQINCIFRANSW